MNKHQPSSTTPHQQARAKRHLPHVLRSGRSRPLTFWPTYKGAVEWLRRHHGTLDTALGLLEIYPSLIQDPTLDGLWEFLSPFFASSTPRAVTAHLPRSPRNAERDIRLSRSRNDPRPPRSPRSRNGPRPPRSHSDLCLVASSQSPGNRQKKMSPTSSHPVANKLRTTRSTSIPSNVTVKEQITPPDEDRQDSRDSLPLISITSTQQDHPEPELQALFDEEDDTPQSTGPPCVYVCAMCTDLPSRDALRQHVLHAMHHDFFVRTGPCRPEENVSDCQSEDLTESDVYVFVLDDSSLKSPACLKRLYTLWSLNIPSVFVKDSDYCLPSPLPEEVMHTIKTLESSEILLVSSARHLPIPRSTTPRCGLSIPASSTTSSSSSSKHRRQESQQHQGESDFILFLLNSYRSALIFEKNDLKSCEATLKERVQFVSGIEASQIGSATHTNSSEDLNAQHDGHQPGLLKMTSSQVNKSPKKHIHQSSKNEHDNRSGTSKINSSVPINRSFLSTAYLDVKSNAFDRLHSPPPAKTVVAGSSLSSSTPANPCLPPVKSPSKGNLLSPFNHLPHLLQQQQQDRARHPAELQATNGAEALKKAEDC